MDDDDFDLGGPDDGAEEEVVDIGAELLRAVIDDTEALKLAHERAVNPELLEDPEHQEAYKDILIFRAKHGRPMNLAIFKERWPDIVLEDEYRDIEYILYDLVKFAKQRSMAKLVRQQYMLMEDNPNRDENLEQIPEIWRQGLSEYNRLFVDQTDRLRTFDPDLALERYDTKARGEKSGIIVPFEDMAQDINSMEWGHVTGIFARPGAKKTFLLAYWLAMVVLVQNHNVLLYSSEMSQEELEERIIGMLAKINYDLLTKGQLKQEDFTRMVDFLKSGEAVELLKKHLFIAGPTSIRSVADIEIYCNENRIRAVGIDNAHTIEARGRDMHNQIHYLMLEIKQMAIRQKMHIIYTTHQNRYGGRGMGGVAYGDAFNTWSSNMMNLKPYKDQILEVSTPKVRNGRGGMKYKVEFNLYTGVIRSLGRQEQEELAEEEEDDRGW
jgi:replicative DNA helicase